MQTATIPDKRQRRSGPFYIRWNPEVSPYTIELKLELVERIAEAIRQASGSGREIGGILLGTIPKEATATLRVDDVQMVHAGAGDGQVFLLNPKQYEQIVKAGDAENGLTPVGVFRTHKRAGAMRPSLADWTLLSGIRPRGTCALLVVEAEEPWMASLFVREDQTFPTQPAVAPFRFDANELSGLPELADRAAVAPGKPPAGSRKTNWLAAAVLGATMGIAAYAWWGTDLSGPFPSPDDNPHLAVSGNTTLRIAWNRHSPLVEHAVSAKLLIVDGKNAREITLAGNELRSGSVEYERSNRTVQVMLVLSMAGDFAVTQSVAWRS